MLWQVQAPQKALAYILHLACDHHTVEPLHKVQLLDCCLCGVTLRRSWLPEQASLEEEPVGDIVLAEDTAMRSTCPQRFMAKPLQGRSMLHLECCKAGCLVCSL